MESSQDIIDTENTTMVANEQINQNPESDEQPSTESNSNLQNKTGAFHRIILVFILTLAFILFLSYLKTIFPSMSDYIDFIIILLLFIGIGYCFLLYYKFFRRKSSNGNLTAEQAANGWSLNAEGQLLNAQGQLVNAQGQLVNAQGQLVNAQGQLVNAQGRFFDAQGRLIDAQGRLIDAQGRLINEKGQLIDEKGRLINEKGQLIDEQGRLIDEQGRLINEEGQLIDEQGRLINEKGQLIDEQGRLINEKGQLIDEQGRAIDEQGRLIDDLGRLIDEQGRLIDEQGRLINEKGQLIDAKGRLVNEKGELLNPDGSVNYYECADYTGILTPAAYKSSSCIITQGGIPSSNNSSSSQLQQLITGEIYLSDDERDVIFVKSSSIFNYYLLHKSKDVFESYGSPPGVDFRNKNNLFIKASVISSGPDSKKNGKKINKKGIEMIITNPGISKVTKSYFYFSKHPPLLLQGDTFTPNTAQSNIFVTSQNSFRLLSEANKVLRNYVSIDGVNFIDETDKGNRAKLLIEPDTILPTSEQVNTRGQCIHLTNAVTEEDTYFYFSLNNSLANTSDFSSADIVNAPQATFAPASSFYQSPNQSYAKTVQQQTQQQSPPEKVPGLAWKSFIGPFPYEYKNGTAPHLYYFLSSTDQNYNNQFKPMNTKYNSFQYDPYFTSANTKTSTVGTIVRDIWYDNNIAFENNANLFGFTNNQLNRGGDSLSLIFKGYFKPNTTGAWNFLFGNDNIHGNDDISVFWINDGKDVNQTTTHWPPSDTNWNNKSLYYHNKDSKELIYSTNLTAGTYYAIQLSWGQSGGGSFLKLKFSGPGTDWRSNGDGFFFSDTDPGFTSPAQVSNTPALILYYPFDKDYKNYASGSAGADGTIMDGPIALNNRNYAVGTGSLYQPERSTNSHFKCESAPANKNGYSFAFWIYFTGTDGLILSFSQNDIGVGGFTRIMIFYTVATNNIYLSCYNSSNTINGNFNTNITPSLNTWYHYTWTLDTNNKNSFYVNGVLSPGFPVTNNNINYGSFALNNNFLMSDSNRDGASIQGYMDDFRYYDGILKETDIKTLYGMRTNIPPALILYYPFDTDVSNYASGTGVSSGKTVGSTISNNPKSIVGMGSLNQQSSSSRNSYFQVPSVPKNMGGYSFSFWMNLSSDINMRAVFSLRSDKDPKYRFLMWSENGKSDFIVRRVVVMIRISPRY